MVKFKTPKFFKRGKRLSSSRKASCDEYSCASTLTLTTANGSLPKSNKKSKDQSGSEEECAPDETRYSLSSTLVDDSCSVIEDNSNDTLDETSEIPISRRSSDYENIAAIARTIKCQGKGVEKYIESDHCSCPTGKSVVKTAKGTTLDSSNDSPIAVKNRNTFLDDPDFLDIINLKRIMTVNGDSFERKFSGDDLMSLLQSRDRIVSRYGSEVWGDLLPTVEATKQDMMSFTKEYYWYTDSEALNQLQIVLDRLQYDQALRESRLKYISEQRRNARNLNPRVQTHVSYWDFSNYTKAKRGMPILT